MRNETERVHGWVGSMYVARSLFSIGGMDITAGFEIEPTVKVAITAGF